LSFRACFSPWRELFVQHSSFPSCLPFPIDAGLTVSLHTPHHPPIPVRSPCPRPLPVCLFSVTWSRDLRPPKQVHGWWCLRLFRRVLLTRPFHATTDLRALQHPFAHHPRVEWGLLGGQVDNRGCRIWGFQVDADVAESETGFSERAPSSLALSKS
jgi:hypothetical protein